VPEWKGKFEKLFRSLVILKLGVVHRLIPIIIHFSFKLTKIATAEFQNISLPPYKTQSYLILLQKRAKRGKETHLSLDEANIYN